MLCAEAYADLRLHTKAACSILLCAHHKDKAPQNPERYQSKEKKEDEKPKYILVSDFEKFKHEISNLYNKLDGSANFDTLESQISIKIKGDGVGHFEADCFVMDFAGTGNKLDFEINFDQTIITELISQLDNITKVFPVQGL